MFVIEPDRFRKLRKSMLWRDCCNELYGSENSHYNLSTKMLDKCAICFYCIYSMEQRQWHPTPMDGGAWWAALQGVTESWTRLSDFTFTFHFHALEKEMATHSSVLAWRIPGTGESGGLPSMGSHRVVHN